jgi:hypothetical protein
MSKNYLVTAGFWYDFTESQAPSCKHFQFQNLNFRAFEAVFWMDFQNFKEQASALS